MSQIGMYTLNIVKAIETPIEGHYSKEENMPNLKPSELDELMMDEDELTDVEKRRKNRKKKKNEKPYEAKFRKINDFGGE